MAHAATLRDPGSGRVMEIYTDQPGIQFYAGNYLDGSYSGQEGKYIRSGRVCAWRLRFSRQPQSSRRRRLEKLRLETRRNLHASDHS